MLEGRSISLPFTVADETGFPSIYSSAAEEEGSRQYSADEEEGSLHCMLMKGREVPLRGMLLRRRFPHDCC